MSKRSSLSNFKPEALTIILENHTNEFEKMNKNASIKSSKDYLNKLYDLKIVNSYIESKIIEKYLEQNISIRTCCKMILSTTGIKQDIFKKIFAIKLLDNKDFIPIDLLMDTINLLDADQLIIIMHTKKGTVYGELANKRFDELLFEVDMEVEEELVQKMNMDERRM